jgi:hypothetical protein
MSNIEIIKWTPKDSGCLEGFVDIYVKRWDLEIFGVTVFKKGGERWISFPSKVYESEGEKKYWPYLRFRDKNVNKEFAKLLIDALHDFRQNPQDTSQYSQDTSQQQRLARRDPSPSGYSQNNGGYESNSDCEIPF